MTYKALLEEIPEDYNQADVVEDVEALMMTVQSLYAAFKKGEDFHAEALQALERAHRLAMFYGGPEEPEDAEAGVAPPKEYAVFTKSDLGVHPIPGRPLPAMSWRKTFESYDEALEAIRTEDTDEVLYLGKLMEDNETPGTYWTNILYYRVDELEDE